MLYSAAGVTLPTVQAAPPITTQRPTFAAMSGAFASASATFVSGPSVTSRIPGRSRILSTSTSTAWPGAGAALGAG